MAEAPGRKRHRMREEDQRHKRARRDLASAERTISGLRTIYFVLAVLTGLALLFVLFATSSGSLSGPAKPAMMLALALLTGTLALLILAITRIRKDPAAWSISVRTAILRVRTGSMRSRMF